MSCFVGAMAAGVELKDDAKVEDGGWQNNLDRER